MKQATRTLHYRRCPHVPAFQGPHVQSQAEAHLLRIELFPLPVVEALDEGDDVDWADHVDEGIAHVALVLEVDGQVEEVKGAAAEMGRWRGDQRARGRKGRYGKV